MINNIHKTYIKKPQPIVFRAEVSNDYGLGHMMRCFSFVESLPIAVKPYLIAKDNINLRLFTKILIKNGWTVYSLPENVDDEKDTILTAKYVEKVESKILITDLVHHNNLRYPDNLFHYHKKLRKHGVQFILSIEDYRMLGFSSHAAIIPIPCPQIDLSKLALGDCKIYSGHEYFIFHPQFLSKRKEIGNIRKNASRVLVCIGGTDPTGLTVKVVNALDQLNDVLSEAKIVLGSGLSFHSFDDVKAICKHSSRLKLLGFSNSIAELLYWSDLAIVGEGLTKYEAAFTGTPSIMISQIDHDSLPVRDFINLGCTRYLGIGEKLSKTEIALAVDSILKDYDTRLKLSSVGKNALDGKGMARIYNRILKEVIYE